DDGSFDFENVPYGNWVIREIESPEGYLLSEEVFAVNIGEAGQVVEIELVNKAIRGNITLTKVDAEYPDNKLTGAVFEVYRDSEHVGAMTEVEAGIYEMNDLKYGEYVVKETVAPEGFRLDENEYRVFIEEDGKTYVIENEAGVGFVNEAQRGWLKILKTSSDGKVEGFSFRGTNADGYDMTFTTDANGEILIPDLRIGEYTISEVNDEVSEDYVLPEDKLANVLTDSTTIVEMHNILRDTPDTGDRRMTGVWTVLLAVSIMGIAGCGVVILVRKKDE
ncbi:MAG: TonB-dependent receptor, partial [Eubacteriaceae bacterium]|nr:TonB-dependent receptor [Eubacteriaceae bacterium]